MIFKNQSEQISKLVAGFNSMTESHTKLQQNMKQLETKKENE